MNQFVVESGAVLGSTEVALGHAPVADRLGHSGYELADSGFTLRGPKLAVEIFAGHDVGGGHGPILGDFDVLLLEDYVALGVGDLREAEIPFDFVVGRDAGLAEEATEAEARGLLFGGRLTWGRGCGKGLVHGFDF